MISTTFTLVSVDGSAETGTLLVSPINGPFNYSGSIVGSRTVHICDLGTATASLVPTAYTARLSGHRDITAFQFDLSLVPDGSTVDAANYLVNYTGSSNYTASYALYAATASYALNGGSSTGSAQFYNATNGLYYNLVISGPTGYEYITPVIV